MSFIALIEGQCPPTEWLLWIFAGFRRHRDYAIDRGTVLWSSIIDRQTIHVHDLYRRSRIEFPASHASQDHWRSNCPSHAFIA